MKILGRMGLALVALLALVDGAAYAAPATQPVTGGHWEAHMSAQNGSGADGTVGASAVDATHTEITIQIANGSATPQPAHVHAGTCANLNPTPKYPLAPVVNGLSDTVIPVDLDTILHGGYAVNVHKSAAEVSTYVSCGDTFVNTAGGTNPGMPTTGAGNDARLWGGLALLALGLLAAGRRLRRAAV